MAKKIILIDGNSIINRAFYAIPLLTNKNGEYTNAVYGFFNIFFKLYDEEKPDYIAVTFDLPKPTFRHLKYKEYKGTRKQMPDELSPQFLMLKELLKKMNIKIYELEGYEADDILGTLAVKASDEKLVPIIVSGDRDLLQIATDDIKIRIPKTKNGKTEVEDYYANDVIAKYGVTPKEYIEVKALMGDKSDNVPGVPGIGEVTATKIIQSFKSVDNAIENYAIIKPKKASENLNEFREQALLSKELVTILTNVPIEFEKDDVEINNMFNNEAYEAFKEHDFNSLLGRFNTKEIYAKKGNHFKYNYIDNKLDAEEFFYNLNPFGEFAYKLIIDNKKVYGISISSEDDRATFISTGNGITEENLFEITKEFFEGCSKKIAHDAKSDIVILNKYGINLNNLEFDVFIAGYLLDSTKSSYSYNDISLDFLSEIYPSEEEIFGKGKSKLGFKDILKDDFIEFAARQSDIFFRAKPIMYKLLEENNQKELFFDIEMPLIYVLADMEMTGIKIDKDALLIYRQELETKISELTQNIYNLAGEEFNINSPKQISDILFNEDKLGLKGGKKTKTGWSTSADVLEKIKDEHEIVKKILEYRTYMKLKTTYADGLLNVMDKESHKIYSTFNQTITATGRISSTEPNLQNIPIKVELGHRLRKIFIPTDENYVFIDGDYSQIELRVLAHMADDETLINAFKEEQDIHRLTASQVFNIDFDNVTNEQRSNAKAVNFGIVYGISAFSLSQDLSITKKEADQYIEGYFEKYPNVKKYMDNTVLQAKEKGFVFTIFNRTRIIPELKSNNFVQRSFGERVAMNMPVQGSAADIIKIAMIKVNNRLKEENLKSKLILQVHDELLIEAHKDEIEIVNKILKDEMENAVKLKVPLKVDVHCGNNWYEAK